MKEQKIYPGRYYKVEAKHSGKVVAVAAGDRSNGANIIQWEWLNSDEQKWFALRCEDDSPNFYLIARHSGYVMAMR